MIIRKFTTNDYDGMATLWTAAYPEHPESGEELRHEDDARNPNYLWMRFIAEKEGEVIGTAFYEHSGSMYNPRKFSVGVCVLPEHRYQGAGSRLYDHMEQEVAQYDPLTLRSFLREDHTDALHFAAKRGYVETMRSQESHLDITAFDPSDFQNDVRRMTSAGVVIKSYSELILETHDVMELRREMYDLAWEISQDIPHPEPQTRPEFEEWEKRFKRPGFLPEAQFYAVHEGKLVGASMLWGNTATPDMNTGMTGVLREYRGKGIATALKVHALTWAKEHSTPCV